MAIAGTSAVEIAEVPHTTPVGELDFAEMAGESAGAFRYWNMNRPNALRFIESFP